MPNTAGQPGASNDPTASHDERCTLASHAITVARGRRWNRNRHRYHYLADLQPQPVEWLWQHRLAAGTLAMLSGEPGSGKTWVALAIAAALTRGRDPFTGEKLKPATVLYASTEHAAAQVIQPHFAGLHGDPARLVILRRADSARSMSSPDSALRDLEARAPENPGPPPDPRSLGRSLGTSIALLKRTFSIVSPAWRSFTAAAFSSFATSPNLAPAGLSIEVGNHECSAALRTEFLVGSSPDAPAQTALLHVKSNLGPLAPPLDYRIGEAGNFHWTGLSNLTPEDLLAARPTGAGLPKRKFAAQWLRDCLQPGSQTQGSIEIAAERDGVCITTLRRAKFDIGVVAPKTENQVPGGGLCPLRRISTRRSTRQDGQINYLSTLSIFMKQTTYLATLPNPKVERYEIWLVITALPVIEWVVAQSYSGSGETLIWEYAGQRLHPQAKRKETAP